MGQGQSVLALASLLLQALLQTALAGISSFSQEREVCVKIMLTKQWELKSTHKKNLQSGPHRCLQSVQSSEAKCNTRQLQGLHSDIDAHQLVQVVDHSASKYPKGLLLEEISVTGVKSIYPLQIFQIKSSFYLNK